MGDPTPTTQAVAPSWTPSVAAKLILTVAVIAMAYLGGNRLTDPAAATASPGSPAPRGYVARRVGRESEVRHYRPHVWTAQAYGIGATEAVLAGFVNPGGLRTEYTFQYGLSKRYGEIAPEIVEEAVVGKQKLEVEEAVDCLRPVTTYHFRIVATNRVGKAYGIDHTFKTKHRSGPARTGFCAASG